MRWPNTASWWDRLLAAVLAGTVVGLVAIGCGPSVEDPAVAQVAQSADTELARVVRQDVTEAEKAEASVGFGTALVLPIELDGLVTAAPPVGALLSTGDVVVEVSGRPLVLVVGASPLYRPLRLVGRYERDEAGTRLSLLKGADVLQLQEYLLGQGFDDKARLKTDEVFGLSTQRAVKAWQTSVGHPATGVVDTTQMVFMTQDLLLQTSYTVGQAFAPIEVTGTESILQVVGSTSLRDFFPVGGFVDVDVDPAVVGVVTRSTRVIEGDGPRQLIEIAVEGLNPEDLGQSVSVIGTQTRATDVLTIPVRALLAMSGGDWQVEVDTGDTSKRVSIELVEVIGTTAIIEGLDEGDNVVVPL